MKMTAKSLAKALGLSERRTRQLVGMGMPSDLDAAREWRRANLSPTMTREGRSDQNPGVASQHGTEPMGAELLAARARRELALAQIAELDLAVREGRLIPLAQLEIGLAGVARQIAAILDGIPAALRRRGSASAADLDFITAEIVRARNEAASIDPETLFADGSENTARAE